MNRLTIIGNLTNNPELRTTPQKKSVCNFTVAVNRRNTVAGQPDTDFFRIAAWNALGENCAKYLAKGKKVAVVGSVSANAFKTKNGEPGASLEMFATDVEFLSPREETVDKQSGMAVVEPDDMPY